jgi:hypothetical protein
MKVARYEVPGSHEKQAPSRRYGVIGCPDGCSDGFYGSKDDFGLACGTGVVDPDAAGEA